MERDGHLTEDDIFGSTCKKVSYVITKMSWEEGKEGVKKEDRKKKKINEKKCTHIISATLIETVES